MSGFAVGGVFFSFIYDKRTADIVNIAAGMRSDYRYLR